jgi:hypothetical protein
MRAHSTHIAAIPQHDQKAYIVDDSNVVDIHWRLTAADIRGQRQMRQL